MHKEVVKTVKIDINEEKDLTLYDSILNNPSCKIIREIREKIAHKTFNDEGKMDGLYEELAMVVTYKTLELLED